MAKAFGIGLALLAALALVVALALLVHGLLARRQLRRYKDNMPGKP